VVGVGLVLAAAAVSGILLRPSRGNWRSAERVLSESRG
jgi:hypothetical protein